MTTPDLHIYPCGSNALTIQVGNAIDVDSHKKVMALYAGIQQLQLTVIKDIIPAYCTVTVVYDVMTARQYTSGSIFNFIKEQIVKAATQKVEATQITERLIEIPVCYHPSLGLDIEAIATRLNITTSEVAALHSADIYQVYMNGFLPGFAYMGTVNEKIATPRLATPRLSVPAGSVGIAGLQTGIYPSTTSGGWSIIGRTPLAMFNASQPQPCLLGPGDSVRFIPISLQQFQLQAV
jgi:inhibitor of KinA